MRKVDDVSVNVYVNRHTHIPQTHTHTHRFCSGNSENTTVKFPVFLNLELYCKLLKECVHSLPFSYNSK